MEIARTDSPPAVRALRRIARDGFALVVVAALITTVLAVGQDLPGRLIPRWFLINLTITTCFGVTVTVVYELAWPRLAPRVQGLLVGAAVHAALVGAGTLVATEVAVRVVPLLGGPPAASLRASVLVVGLAVSAVMVGLHLHRERLRREAREAELDARLQALQARTNPHFLFNSLNALAGLIVEDPERAERLVERLAGVYRHALERAGVSWIRLDEELRAVEDYLAVEEIRLGGRLRVDLECDEAAGRALVPPMILQPLVENAVLHGVAGRAEGGRVRVRITREPERLLLVVEDDGPGPGASRHRGSGTALATLRERLRLSHGGAASVTVAPAGDAGGCRVSVALPHRRAELSS